MKFTHKVLDRGSPIYVFIYFYYLFIYIEEYTIHNIVLGVQQSDSVIYIYIFSDYFPI